MQNKEKMDQLMSKVFKQPKVDMTFDCGRIKLYLYSDNSVEFELDNQKIHHFFCKAYEKKNGWIDSRNAKRNHFDFTQKEDGYHIDIVFSKSSLQMIQSFVVETDKPYFTVSLSLKGHDALESNCLIPLDFAYPKADELPLFLSLRQKMLSVPYDNDMWVRYESAYLKSGRTSYDMTCIYDEENYQSLLIGALDFDTFKNGIRCNDFGARSFAAVSGIADGNTHDCLPHGFVEGKAISSSRFVCGFFPHLKEALQVYGEMIACKPQWNNGPIFGWNSYSALAMYLDLPSYEAAGDFIFEQLNHFQGEDGATYINLDGSFGLNNNEIKKIVHNFHKRGQKAGTYLMPLAHLKAMDLFPLKGSLMKFRKDIVLKKPDGSDYEPVDDKYPIDITLPAAQKDLRLQLQEIVEMGFDYIKIDFLTHGSLEGKRYDPTVRTGRQAYQVFLNILKEELAVEKTGREIFVSFSIAPLLPNGIANGRRACCDSFGHHEDTKYVLNALTYGYWTNGTLYNFNDPDHTVLYYSMVDGRESSTLIEAKSRYNASLISGTIMLLSDNYGPEISEVAARSKERALLLANNVKLNRIASLGAFEPLEIKEDNCIFSKKTDEGTYIALFNLTGSIQSFTITHQQFDLPENGEVVSLNDDVSLQYEDHFPISLRGYDSVILLILNQSRRDVKKAESALQEVVEEVASPGETPDEMDTSVTEGQEAEETVEENISENNSISEDDCISSSEAQETETNIEEDI